MRTNIAMAMTAWLILNLGMLEPVDASDGTSRSEKTTVQGRILFDGPIPPEKLHPVKRDVEYCGQSIADVLVVRDPNTHGVAEVVVSIEGVEKTHDQIVPTAVQLANKECRFIPRVQVAYGGSRLGITSVDPVLHNTHIHQGRKTFLNVAVPPNNRPISKRLGRPGMLAVRCDAHKFMHASIHVFQHPFFSLTDGTGAFTIPGVPPGTYQLNVWHQFFGTHSQTIHVPSVEQHTVQVKLSK